MVTDSTPHMLFECASGSQLRRNLWSDVINNSPKVLAVKMSEMNFRERGNFLLSGFYSPVPVIVFWLWITKPVHMIAYSIRYDTIRYIY